MNTLERKILQCGELLGDRETAIYQASQFGADADEIMEAMADELLWYADDHNTSAVLARYNDWKESNND